MMHSFDRTLERMNSIYQDLNADAGFMRPGQVGKAFANDINILFGNIKTEGGNPDTAILDEIKILEDEVDTLSQGTKDQKKKITKAKVIRIMPQDQAGDDIRNALQYKKLNLKASSVKNVVYRTKIKNERILEIPFGSLFNETNYYKQYDRIINFLKLNGRLICFDYVQYYLSRQGPEIKKTLEDYSKTI